MVKILHEMTPFSAADVVVVSNCEEVRLIIAGGDQPKPDAGATILTQKPAHDGGMPHPPVVFKDAFNFMKMKDLNRGGKSSRATLVAEGLIGGQVVTRDVCRPALRPTRLVLSFDQRGLPLVADGSDLITVVASVTDDNGTVKRLNDGVVRFTVEGPGTLVGDAACGANPKPLRWGTAPALIRAGGTPGVITVRAEAAWSGVFVATTASITINSVAPTIPLVTPACVQRDLALGMRVDAATARDARAGLGEVERQQSATETQPAGER